MYSSAARSFYDILGLPPLASIKEVKTQFKELSKKYHPDLNAHLSDDEKRANNDRFVAIVSAYDTLKDSKKKSQYDATMGRSSGPNVMHTSRRRQQWNNEYYGEAKYYSRANTEPRSSSGLNTKRHRVYYNDEDHSDSTFNGRHVNYGDRHDVPHFNYEEHLSKHLKFEQRLLFRNLSASDRDKIIRQLSKSGDPSEIDEELLTKHLMRQARRQAEEDKTQSYASARQTESARHPHMYQGPQHSSEGEGTALKAMALVGVSSSLYYLWTLL
ncbi:J domain-containing protein [[Candida] zeylanoides]